MCFSYIDNFKFVMIKKHSEETNSGTKVGNLGIAYDAAEKIAVIEGVN